MNKLCSVRYRTKGILDTYAMPHANDNEFEIFQPLDNNGKVIIKNKIYPMKKGALYFIDGINSHCPSPSDAESYRRNIIIFSIVWLLNKTGFTGISIFSFTLDADVVAKVTGGSATMISNFFVTRRVVFGKKKADAALAGE